MSKDAPGMRGHRSRNQNGLLRDNLITSFITIGVALLVVVVLERREGEARTEKDLFLREVAQLSEQMRILTDRLGGPTFDRGFVITAQKNIRSYVSLLNSGLKDRLYAAASAQCDELDALLAQLKEETTDDAKCPTVEGDGLSVVEAKFINSYQRRHVEALCGRVSRAFLELSMCINSQ